jgi:hypothetical protein
MIRLVQRRILVALLLLGVASGCSACAEDDRLSTYLGKGAEVSAPLTAAQVEALTGTAPRGMQVRAFTPQNSEWRELKAKFREGDYFVNFWSSDALVSRTKVYVDGILLVRQGCVVGSVRGAIS